MATLADIIRKKKAQTDPLGSFPTQVKIMLREVAEEAMRAQLADLEAQMRSTIETAIKSVEDHLTRTTRKGDKGDRGEQGETGPQGPRGDRGEAGRAGRDGRDGADGPQGPEGRVGQDGSPDTPEQVVDKVNRSQTKVKFAAIEGLAEAFQKISRSGREKGAKGGGMGNVQHETFNLTSASTSVTTAYKIAGNGYAIIGAFYENGALFRGQSYTVGSNQRTLSLLFTPEDTTQLHVVYVRT